MLELLRLEVLCFAFDDVRRQIEHVLWYFFVGDVVEIFSFFTNLVGVAQRHAEQPFSELRHDVLAGREHHLSNRDHALLANCFADNGERLLPNFAIRHDVIRAIEIKLLLDRRVYEVARTIAPALTSTARSRPGRLLFSERTRQSRSCACSRSLWPRVLPARSRVLALADLVGLGRQCAVAVRRMSTAR